MTYAKYILLLVSLLVMAAQPTRADTVTLAGTVRNSRTGLVIASATVHVFDRSGLLLGSALSNAQGGWSIAVAVTGIGTDAVPGRFALDQNYPNPFNPSTKLPFTIIREGPVRISVHNIVGQLLDKKEFFLHPGSYIVDWASKGGAGVLFYSIESGGVRLTRKMIQLDGGNHNGLGQLSMTSQVGSFRLATRQGLDSCHIVTTSLIYEPNTLTVAFASAATINVTLTSIHDAAFLIDLHNDAMEMISGRGFAYELGVRHTPPPHTDIPRFRDGGVDAQVFSIWISPTGYPVSAYYSTAMKFLDTLKAQAKRNAADLQLTVTADSVEQHTREGKISGLVVVEGGHCIEDNLDKLRAFYDAGVRLMTITWNNSTSWAVSAQDSRSGSVGLNDFGRQVIRTMDSLGMIIDVSHVGRKTVEDILATSKNPIIASHSGAYGLRSHYRNLTDDQIKAIAARGGVIGVVFYPPFLTSGTATLNNVLQHIDYIKNLVGVEYVALGSDFDGIETTPVGLWDVTTFPSVTEALLQRGYTREDVRKILGGNFMRVFRQVCK